MGMVAWLFFQNRAVPWPNQIYFHFNDLGDTSLASPAPGN